MKELELVNNLPLDIGEIQAVSLRADSTVNLTAMMINLVSASILFAKSIHQEPKFTYLIVSLMAVVSGIFIARKELGLSKKKE